MRILLLSTFILLMSLDATAADDIDNLAWMTGLWVQQQNDTVTEVMWSPPRGNTMVGTYRKLKDGEVLYYEILTMRADPEGIEYRFDLYDSRDDFAAPVITRFRLAELTKTKAQFIGRFSGTDRDAELTIEISSDGRMLGWSAFAGDPDSRMVGYDAAPAPLRGS